MNRRRRLGADTLTILRTSEFIPLGETHSQNFCPSEKKKTMLAQLPALPNPPSWFPGHMMKFTRMLPALLKRTNVVLEIRDSRLPLTSINRTLEGGYIKMRLPFSLLAFHAGIHVRHFNPSPRLSDHMTSSQTDTLKAVVLFFFILSFFIYWAHETSFAFNSLFGYQCLTRTSLILQVHFGNGGLNVDGIRLIRADVSSPPKPVNTLWCLTSAILSQRGVWR